MDLSVDLSVDPSVDPSVDVPVGGSICGSICGSVCGSAGMVLVDIWEGFGFHKFRCLGITYAILLGTP